MHPVFPRIALVVSAMIFAGTAGFMAGLRWGGRSSAPGGGPPVMTVGGSAHSTDPLKPDDIAAGLSIPAFTLMTQDGKTITRDDLLGHVTIADFFFTRCIFVCPVLTQHMVDQQAALKGTSVRLLSVSVDPEHETNESLRKYAEEHTADFSRWTFARGDKETIGRIVTGGLQFAVGEDPKRTIPIEGGATMPNIVHPPWFVLIGPKAEVLGIYHTDDEDDMRALTERARAAAKMSR